MEDKNSFEKFNPLIKLATKEDLNDIIRLQQINLAKNISTEEKEKNGFVSVETEFDLLKEIADEEGITLAKDKDKVIGYLMPMTVKHGEKISLLKPFIERFENITFEGKPLHEYKYCILGQVCIDKEYRGKGVLEKLYQELENRLANKYDL